MYQDDMKFVYIYSYIWHIWYHGISQDDMIYMIHGIYQDDMIFMIHGICQDDMIFLIHGIYQYHMYESWHTNVIFMG